MSSFSNVASRLVSGALKFVQKADNATELLVLEGDDNRVSFPSFVGYGTAEQPTIATGVLTVTQSFVDPQPESSTSDTVDSITMSGVQAGDFLLIHVPATNTITFDDANINLAADTRAVAPGGSLGLIYDGTEWTELWFTAATDNADA